MITEKERKETTKMLRNSVKSIKRRNKKEIKRFINMVYALKEQSNLSKDYIQKWDEKDKKYIPGILRIYLEGFESLKEIRYPMNPKLKEIYEFVKGCLRRLEDGPR